MYEDYIEVDLGRLPLEMRGKRIFAMHVAEPNNQTLRLYVLFEGGHISYFNIPQRFKAAKPKVTAPTPTREVSDDEEEYLQALMAMEDDDALYDIMFPAFFALFSVLMLILKRRSERPIQAGHEEGVPPPPDNPDENQSENHGLQDLNEVIEELNEPPQ